MGRRAWQQDGIGSEENAERRSWFGGVAHSDVSLHDASSSAEIPNGQERQYDRKQCLRTTQHSLRHMYIFECMVSR